MSVSKYENYSVLIRIIKSLLKAQVVEHLRP